MIMLIPQFNFRTVAELFRMIEDDGQPIIVPWEKSADHLLSAIRSQTPPNWRISRGLQRYLVQVREKAFNRLVEQQSVVIYHDLYSVLEDSTLYDPQLGLILDRLHGFRFQ